MLNLAGQPKSSAHTGATARVRRRGRQLGGTLFGLIVGLLVGLGIAVAVALFMSRSSMQFTDKTRRPADRTAEPVAKSDELPDPNRSGQKGRPQTVDPVNAPPQQSVYPPQPELAPEPATTQDGAAPAAPGSSATPTEPSATPAPAAPTAAPAPTEPERPASYVLQAGAFKGQEDAESMKARLALIGVEARIITAEVNGVTFYRVRVGPYGQLEDMNRVRSRLADNGVEASVVRQR
jgi:cell division protein FtsN